MRLSPWLLLPAALLSACVHGAGDCAYSAPREVRIDAAGLALLAVSARAGSLEIVGEPGLSQVIASGTACAPDAATLEQVVLRERRSGDRAELAVEIPETSGWGWQGSPSLDLTVRVPASLALDVQDSSGEATIRNVASLVLQDSSGDVDIAGVAGDVSVTDSSGDIDIRDVGGSVHIPSDSSGDIRIVDIEGDVRIDRDSSGEIMIERVRGDATVEVDSSGDIRFETIAGTARVGSDSSGSIHAVDIGRDFIVERDGSGGIRSSNVRGDVRIPDR